MNKLHPNATPPAAIARMNVLVIAPLYPCSTPAREAGGVTSWTCVAPAEMISSGLTAGAFWVILVTSVLEKMFCAREMARAPPRELKKMVRASRNGLVGSALKKEKGKGWTQCEGEFEV